MDISLEDGRPEERRAILRHAAELLDQTQSVLGGPAATAATEAGEMVRQLEGDQATLAAFPDVYKISDQDFLGRQLPVPVHFADLEKQFKFYWIRFPVGLVPRLDWGFNRLEMKISFTGEDAPEKQAKAYQILPDRKFQTLLQVNDHIEVRLDENFEFSAKPPALDAGAGKINASADVKAAAGLGFVAGPFVYSLKRVQIDHNSTGLDWVLWRLDGAEFFQENPPDLVVIAQVPAAAGRLQVAAAMKVYRYFNFAAANLQRAVAQLPEAIRNFFHGGMPIADSRTYDLTQLL